jgi:hypothetical protein
VHIHYYFRWLVIVISSRQDKEKVIRSDGHKSILTCEIKGVKVSPRSTQNEEKPLP